MKRAARRSSRRLGSSVRHSEFLVVALKTFIQQLMLTFTTTMTSTRCSSVISCRLQVSKRALMERMAMTLRPSADSSEVLISA